MFLIEPQPEAQIGPICGQDYGELWVKAANTFGALGNAFLLGRIKGLLQLGVPVEGHLG